MGREDYFLSGSWNVICQRCGEKNKAKNIRKEWTGLLVCQDCWEPRHPQDFIKVTADKISVPYTNPDTDIFLNNGYEFSSTINSDTLNSFELNG